MVLSFFAHASGPLVRSHASFLAKSRRASVTLLAGLAAGLTVLTARPAAAQSSGYYISGVSTRHGFTFAWTPTGNPPMFSAYWGFNDPATNRFDHGTPPLNLTNGSPLALSSVKAEVNIPGGAGEATMKDEKAVSTYTITGPALPASTPLRQGDVTINFRLTAGAQAVLPPGAIGEARGSSIIGIYDPVANMVLGQATTGPVTLARWSPTAQPLMQSWSTVKDITLVYPNVTFTNVTLGNGTVVSRGSFFVYSTSGSTTYASGNIAPYSSCSAHAEGTATGISVTLR